MLKLLWTIQAVSPAALIATLAASSGAIAAETPVSIDTALNEAAQAQVAEVKPNDEIALAPNETVAAEATKAKSLDNVVITEQPTLEIAAPETLNFDTAVEFPASELAQTPSNAEILQEVNRYSNEGGNSLDQNVQGASRFRDVSPNDWAFQALDDLIRRYDCLVGYPDGTFRGNRPLTRYEFAAGLNACLNQIERLIASATADFVTRDDLETLRRLLAEFEAELATLGTRVDNLEARTAFLEDNQFSTTTKLTGEVIFALTSDFTDPESLGGVVQGVDNAVFGDRVRLTLNTSFTGRDTLVTRLAAGNLGVFRYGSLPFDGGVGNPPQAGTGTYEGTQTFNLYPGENNDVQIDWLAYYFPFEGINTLGVDNSYVYVAATGGIWSDIAPTTNPYFEDYDGGNGALSAFASENPIYRIGGGAGAAISFGFSPIEAVLGPSTITLGYLASEANDPSQSSGLFNGDYAALGQVNFNLFDYFAVGLTYVHGYHGAGSSIYGDIVGSYLANNPWNVLDNGGLIGGLPGSGAAGQGATVTNSYGAQIAFRPVDWLSVSGFATKTDAILLNRGDADIWSYGLGLAIPDLGKEGNLLGLFGGIQPSVRGLQVDGLNRNGFRLDDGWHIEGFYKYQVTDNISVTPGVIWLTRPNQNNNSNPAVIGTLRTTFTF
ncbi:MAG: iron uptake porin [Spirulinaceae cyanobacterium]